MTSAGRPNLTLPDLAEAADANFVTHAGWLQRRLPGMKVIDQPDLTLVDSGLTCDTFNFICRARLERSDALNRARTAVDYFRQRPATVLVVGRAGRPTERPGRRAGRGGPGACGDGTGHGRGSFGSAVRRASVRVADHQGGLGAAAPRVRRRQRRKLEPARRPGVALLRARGVRRPLCGLSPVVVSCVPGGYAGCHGRADSGRRCRGPLQHLDIGCLSAPRNSALLLRCSLSLRLGSMATGRRFFRRLRRG